jgi:hypothetical protein
MACPLSSLYSSGCRDSRGHLNSDVRWLRLYNGDHMTYVGILATAGALICLPLLCLAFVRFKELRMRRVLGTLEWLATNLPDQRRRSETMERRSFHDGSVHQAWEDAHRVFRMSLMRYLGLVWNATLQDLYWANRFGAELQRLSLYPLPTVDQREHQSERHDVVRTHIRDFVLIVDRLVCIDRKRLHRNHD